MFTENEKMLLLQVISKAKFTGTMEEINGMQATIKSIVAKLNKKNEEKNREEPKASEEK